MPRPIAVIDIGSNSIKVLVVNNRGDGTHTTLFWKTLDARISAGISRAAPRLSESGMSAGVAAVTELLTAIQAYRPCDVAVVATSAVRDAQNGPEFAAEILRATGHGVRVLTGNEEANYIGRGLTCDPALRDLQDFYLFDLGGGSLECLAFRQRQIVEAKSVPLGCVRLTESCVPDSTRAFDEPTLRRVAETTRTLLRESDFVFSLLPSAVAVGTGGTLTTARAVLAASRGLNLDQTVAAIGVAELRDLLVRVGSCDLAERQRIPGLPAARADVFPTALATLITVAEIGGFSEYRLSHYNLRWGVADEFLSRR